MPSCISWMFYSMWHQSAKYIYMKHRIHTQGPVWPFWPDYMTRNAEWGHVRYMLVLSGEGLKKHVHVEWFLIVNPWILIYNNLCILILIGKQLHEEYAQWYFETAINWFGSASQSASTKLHQPGEEDVANSNICGRQSYFKAVCDIDRYRRLCSHRK